MIAAAQEGAHGLQNRLIVIEQEDMRIPARVGLWRVEGRTRSCDRLTRQIDRETGATCRNVPHANRSTVLRNDSITNAQTETGSFSNGLGGVEGIENSRRILYARATVGKLDDQPLAFHSSADPKIAFGGALQDGIHGVVHHIQEDLLQLMRVV